MANVRRLRRVLRTCVSFVMAAVFVVVGGGGGDGKVKTPGVLAESSERRNARLTYS